MKKFFKVIFLFAIVACAYALVQIITIQQGYQQAAREHAVVRDVAFAHGLEPVDEDDSARIDFEALHLINEDIVGWIYIPGTNIDHPIVQGADNDFYLRTTFTGETNASGSIFMDMRNLSDFSDQQTIIYGHHMRNGTMFTQLTLFQNQDFFDQHSHIMIYTPEGVKEYEIFSAYLAWAYSDTYQLALAGGEWFEHYLQYITGLSMIQTGISPAPTDQIVTLSTCEYVFEDARMVVHGRLIREND